MAASVIFVPQRTAGSLSPGAAAAVSSVLISFFINQILVVAAFGGQTCLLSAYWMTEALHVMAFGWQLTVFTV